IEKASKIMMPALLMIILGIAIFSLTLKHTDDNGVTRTALEGFKIYVIPNFNGITLPKFFGVLLDAMGQLFYSMSLAMGIMITYGSYTNKNDNLVKSVNQIEIFDTAVALLAGLIIIPTVFAFNGNEGLESSGPGLMFVSLPEIFRQMGFIGNIIGAFFFILIFFAALTSSISIMEAIVSSIIDKFKIKRINATLFTLVFGIIVGIIVCLGYNIWYFEYTLPNGATAQILDILDYISNSLMLPVVALLTCVLVWVCKTTSITDEVELGLDGKKFGRKKLYNVMIKFVTPVLLVLILLQSFNVFAFLG
ncbi:MAG: sodium-dependent transporter, partial [Clostridia bacterium]|nr:sodium-dependent transporter [Clostridia bacterium]